MKKYLLIVLCVLSVKVMQAQCNGTVVGYFPVTVNGVTVTQTYTGSVAVGATYTACGVVAGQAYLGGGGSTAFIQKLNFSSPVNNVVYCITAADSNATWGNTESFTFVVDMGTMVASQNTFGCLMRQSGNSFYATVVGNDGNGTCIVLNSSLPYNSLTVSGPGGNNGSFMALCSSSIGIDYYTREEQLVIYPNPSPDGHFTVSYSIGTNAEMQISDLSGVLVSKYSLPGDGNQMEINNENLAKGIYIYKIVSGNTILKTGKIVIIE